MWRKRQFCESNRLPAPRLSLNMDNMEKLAAQTDFWRGILFGAMAGMVIATYAYAITDFKFKEPAETSQQAKPKLSGQAVA
ncbi:MAG: hypothetical protein WA634_06635 [Silvibacterium sp.]